jgi:hypothetical protein
MVVAATLQGIVAAWTPAAAEDALPAATILLKKLDLSASAAGSASTSLRATLTPAQAARLTRIGATFARTRDRGPLLRDWQRFIAEVKPPPGNIDALVQSVLRESYVESAEDLRNHAEKVKAFNDRRKALREKLTTVGEDAQLANVDLQNVLQKQQQMLQMMSNISKTLHDSAMAVIRKIGG